MGQATARSFFGAALLAGVTACGGGDTPGDNRYGDIRTSPGDSATGGDTAGGDPTGGDTPGGDPIGGDARFNRPPTADAGENQNVSTGTTVTLDGSGSSDPNGDALTYAWNLVSTPAGSGAALSNTSALDPAFVADLDGSYVVRLVVNDGRLDSPPDSVTVVAGTDNFAPVADAGPDQNANTGTTVTLDGSGSSDADLDPLTYSWSFDSVPSGSTATLSDPSAVSSTFVPDILDLRGGGLEPQRRHQ